MRELDLGVVVPDEDRVEEGVLAQVRDDHGDVIGALPVQDDGGRVADLARLFVHLDLLRFRVLFPHPLRRVSAAAAAAAADPGRELVGSGGRDQLGEDSVRVAAGEAELGRIDSAVQSPGGGGGSGAVFGDAAPQLDEAEEEQHDENELSGGDADPLGLPASAVMMVVVVVVDVVTGVDFRVGRAARVGRRGRVRVGCDPPEGDKAAPPPRRRRVRRPGAGGRLGCEPAHEAGGPAEGAVGEQGRVGRRRRSEVGRREATCAAAARREASAWARRRMPRLHACHAFAGLPCPRTLRPVRGRVASPRPRRSIVRAAFRGLRPLHTHTRSQSSRVGSSRAVQGALGAGLRADRPPAVSVARQPCRVVK